MNTEAEAAAVRRRGGAASPTAVLRSGARGWRRGERRVELARPQEALAAFLTARLVRANREFEIREFAARRTRFHP